MIATRLALGFVLTAGAVLPARGQGPRGRTATPPGSFWIGAGVGATWLRVSCSICDSDRGTAASASVAMGGTAGQGLLIGAEASGRFKREGGVRETVWTFGAAAFWYPRPARHLYWKVGAGVVLYRSNDGTNLLSASPLGIQLGVGHDIESGRRFRLSPFANLHVASWGGGIYSNGAPAVGDASVTMIQVGLNVTRR